MAARNNPSKGGKPDKLMRDALILELKGEAADADGKPTQKLRLIARKLVDVAIGGDVAAIREVTDRVDGRPAQALDLKHDVSNPLMELMREINGQTRGIPGGG